MPLSATVIVVVVVVVVYESKIIEKNY